MQYTTRLKCGDLVRVRAKGGGDWARAVALLASDTNPSSVMLALVKGDGLQVDGAVYLNCLPVTVDYERETVEGLLGGEFEIEVADAPPDR